MKLKILMVASEVEPFAKTGGLGDVVGALPKALVNNGQEVAIIMPKYRIIPEKYVQEMQYLGYIYVDLNWRHQYCGIFKLNKDGVNFYFIDNEFYFGSYKLYDNYDLERFCFLSKATFEVAKFIKFKPHIIHAHDWHTGLVPVLLDNTYRHDSFFKKTKSVFTIHNLQYQGKFDIGHVKDMISIDDRYYNNENVTNFMKMAIINASLITTVSPSYVEEIKTEAYGEGLHKMLGDYYYKLIGILNGIDYSLYNPENDNYIYKKYNEKNYLEGKQINKQALLNELNISNNNQAPLIGIITRLASQKGIDLILSVMEELLQQDVNMVLLGNGEYKYEQSFRYFESRYPTKFKALIKFDNVMAHKIYAGCDLFLMPSIFEPCGLAQMISLKYGTLPIVREVGGLKDTIKSFNEYTNEGNGFSFTYYNRDDFYYTIKRAFTFYNDKPVFNKIIENGLKCDFSWNQSALKYIEIYNKIIKEK